MCASPAIEWPPRPDEDGSGIDRKALAGILLEIAQDLKPELRAQKNGVHPTDLRLEQIRTLLVGREIELLSRLRDVIDDPEKLAAAVGRVLPGAIAEATGDTRLGHVLAPAMEKATESSIRQNPRTLVDILYPLIVPIIGKSIRETIAATFQSFNQTLKYSLTWRGLKWRWEAWRTGVTFAEVALRQSLVYQVEHVFLIHRHTGLLISHVAAEHAESQDPQLVSSMLVAITDFVRDSFAGGEQQLDDVRLGELKLWCEPGPFAMLVAVIRGDPPENMHETLRHALSRIHAERHQALEAFDGDSSGLADVEAELRECLTGQKAAAPKARFGRIVFLAWLAVMLLLAGAFVSRSWRSDRMWQTYIDQMRAEPGIVVMDSGRRGSEFFVAGLRDPLAVDPQTVLRQVGIDADRVVARWTPYQALDAQSVLRRLKAALEPPPGVTLAIQGDRIAASGAAPAEWLDRAHIAARNLPAGAPAFDLSGVRDTDEAATRLWAHYLGRLRAEPGIVVTENGRRDGAFFVSGLRDPLAADPTAIMRQAGIDPEGVVARWTPYQSLDPQFVLKRLQTSIEAPDVTLAIEGDRIVAQGSASSPVLERARVAARTLQPGALTFDLSGIRDVDEDAARLWNDYVTRLRAAPGIVVTEAVERDGTFFVTGLRDPLAADPAAVLGEVGLDPARVSGRWSPYQALDAPFVLKRLQALLRPPSTVTLAIEGDRIVAQGSAPAEWLQRARAAALNSPAGAPVLDLSAVRDTDEAAQRLWAGYLDRLRAEPGIVITEADERDGSFFFIRGLRDPLAADPEALLREAGIDPGKVAAQWTPYQSLDPQFVLKRLHTSLEPPAGVTLALEGDRITARGSAPAEWLDSARLSARMLPPGAPAFDISGIRDVDAEETGRWADYITRLRAERGIVVTEMGARDGKFFISGLRDPLAVDPDSLLAKAGVDPAKVVARWAPYQALDAPFVLRRLRASLDLPPTVTLAIEGDRIVALGSASPLWIGRAQQAGRMLPAGGPTLDLSRVRDLFEGAIGKLRDAIESRNIHFAAGGSLPAEGMDALLDEQARDIQELASLSAAVGVNTRVTLIGHADSAGQGTSNLSLTVARAEAVRALLKKRGVNPDLLAVRGAGAFEPLQEETSDAARSANRRVSFSVGIVE